MSAPVVKKNRVEQKIELKELFRGVDLSNRDLKEFIGEAIIDYMRERTLSGQGVRFSESGRGTSVTFKNYSKAYTESDDFKAFGKSKNEVNLKLTGDMLGLMDIVDVGKDSITIGWNDDDQNPKAFNHITGDTVPSRPFFGVSKNELSEIAKTLRLPVRQADSVAKAGTQDDLRDFLRDLRDELANEQG